MQTYDIATAITQAQARIDRIIEHNPNPEKQALHLLSEGCRIAETIAIHAAGGKIGWIDPADLILMDRLHDALHDEPFALLEFVGWPRKPETFLIWGRDSARELLGAFLAAMTAALTRCCPAEIFDALAADEPPRPLRADLFANWIEAVLTDLKSELKLTNPSWRPDYEKIRLIFEHEVEAYFAAQEKPEPTPAAPAENGKDITNPKQNQEPAALAYLVKHPDATNKQIADAIDVHPKTVARYKSIQNARKAQKDKTIFAKGRKDKNGNLDAWDLRKQNNFQE